MRGRQRKYSLILNKSVNVPITTYLTWPDPNLCCGNLSLWPGHMNLNHIRLQFLQQNADPKQPAPQFLPSPVFV